VEPQQDLLVRGDAGLLSFGGGRMAMKMKMKMKMMMMMMMMFRSMLRF